MKRPIVGVISVLFALISLQAVFAQNETVISQCDYQHVVKALTTGGDIVLDCDSKIQIWSNKPLTITANTRIKPAEGREVTFEALKGRAFVVNADVKLTLERLTIEGNRDQINGGIENNGGTLTISNVTFTSNDNNAIHNHEGGSVTIENSIFSSNNSYTGGGAIYNDAQAEVSISNSQFDNNHSWSDSNGGAIYNLGTMTISGSSFTSNDAQGQFGWGGAIYNTHDGIHTVINSTFANNTAGHSGGAIRSDANTQSTISFSTFVENNSDTWGGALYSEGGTLTVSNSLFSINTANGKASDCEANADLGTISANLNLSDAGCGETRATGVATLANNGGFTQTVAIASTSNAIDAAGECPTITIDQRGTPRPQGKGCDIGAFEYVDITTAATSVGICQITTTRDVRLRAEPNTAGSILAVVTHGLKFQAIGQVTGWYHITYGTLDGWISADFATATGDCGG